MQKTGIGVDIFEIARMKKALERRPHLKRQLFSEEEIRYAEAAHFPYEHFSAFFAAKEAVAKAMGLGFCAELRPRDICITHDRAGKPFVEFSERAQIALAACGLTRVLVSLSHTKELAIANALALPKQEPKEKTRPRAEQEHTSIRYKEALAILDEYTRSKSSASLTDAGLDASLDASLDTSLDASLDTGIDASVDAPSSHAPHA